jgi:hypothetical protein
LDHDDEEEEEEDAEVGAPLETESFDTKYFDSSRLNNLPAKRSNMMAKNQRLWLQEPQIHFAFWVAVYAVHDSDAAAPKRWFPPKGDSVTLFSLLVP